MHSTHVPMGPQHIPEVTSQHRVSMEVGFQPFVVANPSVVPCLLGSMAKGWLSLWAWMLCKDHSLLQILPMAAAGSLLGTSRAACGALCPVHTKRLRPLLDPPAFLWFHPSAVATTRRKSTFLTALPAPFGLSRARL